MGRYGSPPPGSSYSPPHAMEHLSDALDRAFSTYAAVRGMKQEDADRQRAEEDRQRQIANDLRLQRRGEAVDATNGLMRGARPVDQTSVMSGVTLNGVGRTPPFNPHARDPLVSAMLEQEGGFGGDGGSYDGGQLAGEISRQFAEMTPGRGVGGGFTPEAAMGAAAMPSAAPVPMRPPGSFDPSTGTFTRSQIGSPMMQQPAYSQVNEDYYIEHANTPSGRAEQATRQRVAQDAERQLVASLTAAEERRTKREALLRAGVPEAKVDAVLEYPELADNYLFPNAGRRSSATPRADTGAATAARQREHARVQWIASRVVDLQKPDANGLPGLPHADAIARARQEAADIYGPAEATSAGGGRASAPRNAQEQADRALARIRAGEATLDDALSSPSLTPEAKRILQERAMGAPTVGGRR